MVKIKLTEEQMNWLEIAIDKGLTRLQVIKKLEEAKYSEDLIEEMVRYFDDNNLGEEMLSKEEKITKKKDIKEDEKRFKKQVEIYLEQPDKLSWGQKREVKKFLKNCAKYNKTLGVLINGIYMEMEEIKKKFEGQERKIEKEIEKVRIELIDRVLDTKEIFELEHPYSGKSVEDKKDLLDVRLEDLITLLEENIGELNMVVNGKI